ncbi:MAG: sigma-70 family RNA polymerase sigma factor [Pirellulaceae bacterium]|nr:sigma-70 family RNA polymerase sigma factor [Pirellulaceae bacterium]
MPHSNSRTLDHPTSSTLLSKVKLRQNDAWGRMVREYGPLIYNHARQLGLTPDEAGDLTQEVLAAVLTSIGRFERKRDQDSFRGWLKGVTRNKVRDFFRRQSKRVARAVGGSHALRQLALVGAPDPSTLDSRPSDATLRVRRALTLIEDDFQPRSWQAFWRTAIENQDATCVAAQLGMRPAAVRKAKSRVMDRLRQELQSGD